MPSDAIWLAVIAGVVSIVTLVLKHFFEKSDARMQSAESRLDAYEEFLVDIVTYAFDLEEHIQLGKPPPPPERPQSLIKFFALRLSASASSRKACPPTAKGTA